MKRLLWLIMVFICFATTGDTQNRDAVLVDYFTKEREIPFIYTENIRRFVIEGFLQRNRLDVIDAQTMPAMNPMRMGSMGAMGYGNSGNSEKQRTDAIGKSGARYIVTGHVAGYKFTSAPSGKYVTYTSTFKVLLNGYDMFANQQIPIEQYELTARGSTLDEADAKAMSYIANKIGYYVNSNMKFETEVIQLCTPDAKGHYSLYIGAGRSMGVSPGDQFVVFAEESIQGRAIRRELGRITVQSVDGNEVSLCSTRKKQAPEIIRAFNNRSRLIAVSAGVALFF